MGMNITELVEVCKNQGNCSNCPDEAKASCKEFKIIMKGVTEPWEITRLIEIGKTNR